MTLHPSENRGYREAYAFGRAVADHWPNVAEHLPAEAAKAYRAGAEAAEQMVEELGPLTEPYGLYGKPAAQGLGKGIGRTRGSVRDRFLETDRAARMALLELQYLTTLLGYLAAVAQSRGDERLEDFGKRQERRFKRLEGEARKAAVELGARPDEAIRPYDPSALGRAAHSLGYAAGAVGEWIDRRAAR